MSSDPSLPASTPNAAAAARMRPSAPRAGALDPQQLLARLWKQNLPLVRERVAVLQTAASDNASGAMTAEARTEASNLAHKLAGSLGMFGYGHGTEIARALEQMLDAPEPVEPERFTTLTEELRATLPL